MTHTPGPWFVASNADDGGVPSAFGRMRDVGNDEAECIMGGGDEYRSADQAIAPGPRIICWTQMSETEGGGEAITDEDRANASLIAAAPELLGLVKWVRDNMEPLGKDPSDGVSGWRHMDATEVDSIVSGVLHFCDEVIAKAEGRIE